MFYELKYSHILSKSTFFLLQANKEAEQPIGLFDSRAAANHEVKRAGFKINEDYKSWWHLLLAAFMK